MTQIEEEGVEPATVDGGAPGRPDTEGEGVGAAAVAISAPQGDGSAANSLADLFTQLRVERTAEGGMRLEVPSEAASALALLFEGIAKLVRSSQG